MLSTTDAFKFGLDEDNYVIYERNAWYIYITFGTNDLEKDARKEDLYLRAFPSNYVCSLGHIVGTAEQVCPMGYT